jgi:hypothetical protein
VGAGICSVICDADSCEGLSTLTKMSLKIGLVRDESLEVARHPVNCWMLNMVAHKVIDRLIRAMSGTGVGILADWEGLIENMKSAFYLAHTIGHFLSASPILSHETWLTERFAYTKSVADCYVPVIVNFSSSVARFLTKVFVLRCIELIAHAKINGFVNSDKRNRQHSPFV